MYQPRPMALPSRDHPSKEDLPDDDDGDGDGNSNGMMPAATPGGSAVTLRRRRFAANSMEHKNETDWDSESDQQSSRF